MNIPADIVLEHIEGALARGLEPFRHADPHGRSCAIVCGGPSLAQTYREITQDTIVAANGAHDWLIERGIVPDECVAVDGKPFIADFFRSPRKDVLYVIASQCDPAVFDALDGFDVRLWHSWTYGVEDLLNERIPATKENPRPWVLVGGGGSVGGRCMSLKYLQGYRDMHLFGMDSCYGEAGQHHAYPQGFNLDEINQVEIIEENGRKFVTAEWMRSQAEYFRIMVPKLKQDGVKITVHGDGLLSEILKTLETMQ